MQVLNVAKSDVAVVQGLKTRDKVLSVADLDIGIEKEGDFVRKFEQQLRDAVIRK